MQNWHLGSRTRGSCTWCIRLQLLEVVDTLFTHMYMPSSCRGEHLWKHIRCSSNFHGHMPLPWWAYTNILAMPERCLRYKCQGAISVVKGSGPPPVGVHQSWWPAYYNSICNCPCNFVPKKQMASLFKFPPRILGATDSTSTSPMNHVHGELKHAC